MQSLMMVAAMVLAGSPPHSFPSAAGEIFGDVRIGETYVPDAAIKLTCGADVVEGKTDKAGSYRLKSKADGKCTVQITYKGSSPTVDVVVFERPTRYRLVLEEKNGKYTLKRV